MKSSEPDHYAALGLDRRCTGEQIRAAYRLLAKQNHPDVNHGANDPQMQKLNAAYETLSDAARRQTYDEELSAAKKISQPARGAKEQKNISQDVHLRSQDFLRGTILNVRVNDPGNPNGAENYELVVPAMTAPGTRFKIPREEPFQGGFVLVRVKARPDFRFKVRGSDLRCDLKISLSRATNGGLEMIAGPTGGKLNVPIPRGVARGVILKIPGEGLPKTRGGRGDVLVRIIYRPEIHITRAQR